MNDIKVGVAKVNLDSPSGKSLIRTAKSAKKGRQGSAEETLTKARSQPGESRGPTPMGPTSYQKLLAGLQQPKPSRGQDVRHVPTGATNLYTPQGPQERERRPSKDEDLMDIESYGSSAFATRQRGIRGSVQVHDQEPLSIQGVFLVDKKSARTRNQVPSSLALPSPVLMSQIVASQPVTASAASSSQKKDFATPLAERLQLQQSLVSSGRSKPSRKPKPVEVVSINIFGA